MITSYKTKSQAKNKTKGYQTSRNKYDTKNIKKYIQSKDFSLDNLIKIYRVEHDYLKYEERHMKRFISSLNETLINTKKDF